MPASRSFARQLELAALMRPCTCCKDTKGLCWYHAHHDRELMPLLAEPEIWRNAISGRWRELHAHDDELSPEGRRVAAAKERKRLRRLKRAIAGEFTPVRRSA